MRSFFFGLVLILIVQCGSNPSNPAPKVANGIVDLREWDFSRYGPISLQGEWKFFPQNFSQTEGSAFPSEFRFPGVYSKENSKTFGTFYLKILTNTELPIHLCIPRFYSNFTLFCNNELVLDNGSSETNSGIDPIFKSQCMDLKTKEGNQNEIELYLFASNFRLNYFGMFGEPKLGLRRDLERAEEISLLSHFLLFGALVFIGMYHIGLYSQRRNELSYLYFSIICILIAFRSVSMEEIYLQHIFHFSLQSFVHIELLSIYLIVPLFSLYLHSFYPNFMHKNWIYLFIGLSLLLSALTLLSPLELKYRYVLYIQVAVILLILLTLLTLYRAIRNKLVGSYLFSFGFLILSLTAINDILLDLTIVSTFYMTPLGLIFFILTQSFVLSLKFSQTLEESKRNQIIASENFISVIQAKKEIEKLIESKDKFLANMSFEIKTPLNTIQKYAELVNNFEVTKEVRQTNKDIMQNAKVLNYFLNDLIYLTELDSGIALKNTNIFLHSLIEEILEHFSAEIKKKKLEIKFEYKDDDYICDPESLKIAISAVIKNSIVYNRENGKISIKIFKMGTNTILQIEDTGIGIDPTTHSKLYQRFTRGSSPDVTGVFGMGIGLTIAKTITDLHKSNLIIKSIENKSTTAVFLLKKNYFE